MAEILSRSEIELLLSALHPQPAVEPAARGGSGPATESGQTGTTAWEERASELVRTAVAFSERFRFALQETAHKLLDAPVTLRRFMPRRLSLRQLLEQPSSRPFWIVLEAEQTTGDLVIALEHELAVGLVRSALGFSSPAVPESTASVWTELDGRLFRRFVHEACVAARPPLHADITLAEGLEHFSSWNSQEAWWVEHWELRTQEFRGQIRFASPWQLHAHSAGSQTRRVETHTESASHSLDPAPSKQQEFVVELARIDSTPAGIVALRVGDVLVTDREADSPVRITLENGETREGIAGLQGGKLAVRVQRPGRLPEVGE